MNLPSLSRKTKISIFLFFLSAAAIPACTMTAPKDISMDTDYIIEGTPIRLSASHIRSSDVDSCIWYVGNREVSRTRHLVSYTPAEEDLEHFIRVSVILKDGTCCEDSRYFSVLPVLCIDSDTDYENITKDKDVPVSLRLSAGPDYPSSQLYSGSARIHLRGNSTSVLSKLPFKLKLEKEADLLDLGNTRHWVLLANAIDSTLFRNKLVYDFSGEIGAPCHMHSEQVTLIYNGTYQGVYQLCEQVRIGENSVNIYDWESEGFPFTETAGLYGYPEASGGVLLEMDFFHKMDACLKTNYRLPFYFNRPMEGEAYEELYSYTREHLQALEYAFHDTDFTYHNASPHYRTCSEGWFDWHKPYQRRDVTYTPACFYSGRFDGAHYSELVDMDSLLVNFLLCEFTVNWDAMKNSVFLYKDIEGPFYFGPAWDYDWAFGNGCYGTETWEPGIWQTTDEFFANEQYYQTVQWNRYLIRDPYFLACLYEKYREVREGPIEELICDGGRIDQYAGKLKPAADANDARWGGCEGNFEGQKFDEGIKELKRFIRLRTAWLDEQFASIDTLCRSLGYYVPSDMIQVDSVETGFLKGITVITVHTACPGCAEISFQADGTHFYRTNVTDGSAVLLLPNRDIQNEKNTLHTVQIRALDENGSYLINPEGTVPGDYTNAISNYACFRLFPAEDAGKKPEGISIL